MRIILHSIMVAELIFLIISIAALFKLKKASDFIDKYPYVIVIAAPALAIIFRILITSMN
ncbi:MAG: hypothetical protein LKJ75_11485 [Clostridia bacterium]|nr:hypothetical protein [Clostridia bacterium]MCI2015812.1 hypothetical protein [Clostridia bacterium]